MPTVHFLNVCDGDCSIIQHGSGRVSMIDICNGKTSIQSLIAEAKRGLEVLQYSAPTTLARGNYGMRDKPTDPVAYLKKVGINGIFRFILTHPDMDHIDGFKALCDEVGIHNFWDSGVRKAKPDFSGGKYREEDWDQYVNVRNGKAGVTVVTPRAGGRFQFANRGDPEDRGDGLYIVSPNTGLINAANLDGDANDGSYVLVYKSCGGKIIFPGDAHDGTWDYVLENHSDMVKNCAVLIAPHHGRHSDRQFDFLDVLNPALTLFGCADSEHLAYDAWSNRDLQIITNNQAGNVILDATSAGINVYLENLEFAKTFNAFNIGVKLHDCYYIGQATEPQPVLEG